MTTITRIISGSNIAKDRVCIAGLYSDADKELKELLDENNVTDGNAFILLSSDVVGKFTDDELEDIFLFETMYLQHVNYHGKVVNLSRMGIFLGYLRKQAQCFFNAVGDSMIRKETLLKAHSIINAEMMASPIYTRFYEHVKAEFLADGKDITFDEFNEVIKNNQSKVLDYIEIGFVDKAVVRPGEVVEVITNEDAEPPITRTGVVVDYLNSWENEITDESIDLLRVVVIFNNDEPYTLDVEYNGKTFVYRGVSNKMTSEELEYFEDSIGVKKALGIN